jgi:hypothetical protein
MVGEPRPGGDLRRPDPFWRSFGEAHFTGTFLRFVVRKRRGSYPNTRIGALDRWEGLFPAYRDRQLGEQNFLDEGTLLALGVPGLSRFRYPRRNAGRPAW